MRSLRLTAVAALLLAAAVSAQAGEIRLDDAALDSVSAGLSLPTNDLFAQQQGQIEQTDFYQLVLLTQAAIQTASVGDTFGGLLGGLLGGGSSLPFSLPVGLGSY